MNKLFHRLYLLQPVLVALLWLVCYGCIDRPPVPKLSPQYIAEASAKFCVNGNYLYALGDGVVKIYNISDPVTPVLSDSVFTNYSSPLAISTDSIYLFVGYEGFAVDVYNISNPVAPQAMATLHSTNGRQAVKVHGDYVFSTVYYGEYINQNQLSFINISHPSQPVYAANTLPYLKNIDISGNRLFACGSDISVYDISNVSNIGFETNALAGECLGVYSNGSTLAVVSADGLYQFAYSSPTLTFLSKMSYK